MEGGQVLPSEGVQSGQGSGNRTPAAVGSPASGVSTPQVVTVYGPSIINNVGTATNANLGINHGSIQNNTINEPVPPSQRLVPDPSRGTGEGAPSHGAGPVVTHPNNLFTILNPIPDASHLRNRERSPPNSQCFPGTRQGVLGRIHKWVDSSLFRGHPHVFWVYGYAGCGKSAISQAVCEYYAAKKRLAASFFFFRGSGSRSTVAGFATTLASQIVAAIPGTIPSIEKAIHRNRALLTSDTSLTSQFEHLVLKPMDGFRARMSAILRHGPFLLVLDGLDECEDCQEICALVELLIGFFETHPHIPFRILVTSRVESHIHKLLHSSSQVSLLNLVDHTSDADISAALDVAIKKEVKGRVLACDPSWPSLWDRQRLVEHLGGSFIFMTTIVKLLFSPETHDGLTPMDRLPLVLGTSPDFDGLYRAILVPWSNLPHFRSIMSTIALAFEPLTIAQLAELLALRTADIVNVLVNLHAVIQVPGDDHSPVTLWHTSLRDFFCSADRAGPSLLADPVHHLYLALRCAALFNGTPQSSANPSWKGYVSRHAGSHLRQCAKELDDTTSSSVAGTVSSLADALGQPWFGERCPAIEYVCLKRWWTLADALVAASASVTTRYQFQNKPGSQSALHLCAIQDKHAIARFLLKHGADPNVKDSNGGTPLHDASWNGHAKVMQHLLEFGVDPNIQGNDGWTPLHVACFYGHAEAARLLLDHNADPSIKNRFGETPLHYACDNQQKSIVALFSERGIKK